MQNFESGPDTGSQYPISSDCRRKGLEVYGRKHMEKPQKTIKDIQSEAFGPSAFTLSIHLFLRGGEPLSPLSFANKAVLADAGLLPPRGSSPCVRLYHVVPRCT